MSLFLVYAVGLIALALVMVLPALLRRRPSAAGNAGAPVDAARANVQVLREQLAALDAERAAGGLDDAQYQLARSEIERRALEEDQAAEAALVVARRSVKTAVVLALFTVVKKRVQVVLAGVLVTAFVVALALRMNAMPLLLNFLLEQGDRGMQLEATFTTPWLWMSVLGIGGARMYMNRDINSMQVDGPGSEFMSFLMQPLLIAAALLVAALIFWALHTGKRNGGADRTALLLFGSLALVTAFVVFNKVGSPQFMVWLAPAVAVGLAHQWKAWRVPATMLIGVAVLTFLVYPLFYDALSHNNPLMAGVLTARNALLVILFVWSVRQLVIMGRNPQAIPRHDAVTSPAATEATALAGPDTAAAVDSAAAPDSAAHTGPAAVTEES